MKMNKMMGILGAAVLASAVTANAVTSEGVRVSFDGGTTWVTDSLNDGDGGDLNPTAGSMLHVFTFSGVGITIVIASGSGSGTSKPKMDLGITGNLAGGVNVIVEFSANGFTPPSGGTYLTSMTVNGSGYSVTETTRLGSGVNGNDLFATGGTLPSIGPITVPPSNLGSAAGGAPVGTSDPYSITISEVISTTSRTDDASLSIDTHLSVPDGGNTLMLLGSGLSALGGFGLLRKARKA